MTAVNDLRLQDAPMLAELEQRLAAVAYPGPGPSARAGWRTRRAQVRGELLSDAAGHVDGVTRALPREARLALAWLSTEVADEYVAGVASLLAYARQTPLTDAEVAW